MGLGDRYGATCEAEVVETANKYLGTYYDTIKEVYDHLEQIKIVAELGTMEKGLTGDTPDVFDNGDGTYTITGENGSITISDGFSPTVEPNLQGNGVDITDANGNVTEILNGFGKLAVFAYRNDTTAPDTPTTGAFDGTVVTPPNGFSNDPQPAASDEDIYVTYCIYHETRNGLWTRGDWSTPARFSGYSPIKGVDYFDGTTGNYHVYVYKNGIRNLAATTPFGGSFDGTTFTAPDGWTDDPTTPESHEVVWVSHTVFVQDNAGNWSQSGWSIPAIISGYTPQEGVDYTSGLDGSFNSSVYYTGLIVPNPPSGGSYDGTNEIIPNGWSNDPVLPSQDGEEVWMSRRIYTHNGGTNYAGGDWSVPVKVSGSAGYTPQKGVDYFDGIGGAFTSFIYKLSPHAPALPVGGTFDGVNEVAPNGWLDDPTTPTGNDNIWVSQTQYRYSGTHWVHSGWSEPVQFNGSAGVAQFTSEIFINATEVPNAPPANEGSYDGTTEIVPTDWSKTLEPTAEGEASYMSQAVYTFSNDVWSHSPWSQPVLYIANVDLSQEVTELEQNIENIISQIIWNTVHHHETVTESGRNVASVRENANAITNETLARATLAEELYAAIELEATRISAQITRLDNVSADVSGNASAISSLSGRVNSPTNGLDVTYSIASQAQTLANGNSSSITSLQNTVGDASSGLVLQAQNNTDSVTDLSARAYLGIDVEGRVSGVHIEGSANASAIELKADRVSFVTPDGTDKLVWNGSDLSFSGDISAASGEFSGAVNATFDGRTAGDFTNTSASSGWALVAQHTGFGTAFQADSTSGNAIVCNAGGTNGRAIDANHTSNGTAIDADSTAGVAVDARGGTRGVSSVATYVNGIGVYGQGDTGVRANGSVHDFYAGGSGTNYAPFTGAHEGLLPINHPVIEVGDILCDEKLINIQNVSNAICEMSLSNEPNQKAVRGILVHRKQLDTSRVAGLDNDVETHNLGLIYDLVSFNSLGEGAMNVCGEGGNIEPGDLIVSSSIPGKGMKQQDSTIRNNTVAEARHAVSFDSPEQVKQIAVIYRCG